MPIAGVRAMISIPIVVQGGKGWRKIPLLISLKKYV